MKKMVYLRDENGGRSNDVSLHVKPIRKKMNGGWVQCKPLT
jgi:hypothetical protein